MNAENIQDIYELSPLQQGILFHSLSAPESAVYFVQLCYGLRGNFNVLAFERAWQQVTDRHTILRTSFYWENLEKPIQVVHRQVKMALWQYDWRNFDSVEQQERLKEFLKSDRASGFDFSQAPLMRLSLLCLTDDSYYFVWSKHHLLLDGWSTALVLKEVIELYEVLCQGENVPVATSFDYGDYIGWLQQQDLSKAEVFWKHALSGIQAPTPLISPYTDNLSNQQESYKSERIKLSKTTTAALQSLVRQHQMTLNTLAQGAWAVLLGRYSGESDVVYGATVSGRPVDLIEAESMVGMFINTLPVRVKLDAEQFLLPWLKQLQAQLVELRQYEYSPLIEVQGWSEVPRGLPLFENILVFENYPTEQILNDYKEKLEIQSISVFEKTNYPLTVTAIPGAELEIRISYDCHRFDTATITRMLGHFQTLLQGMVSDPQICLKDLPLLSEPERHQLLVEWNNTQAEYPQNQCIHQLFEIQVEHTPDAVAVVFESEQLTYCELNARANQLAHHLRSLGVRPEVLVGICVERSLCMVIGLLGILKAGGAYVPLDPGLPKERLAFIREDAEVPVLLTQARLIEGMPQHKAKVVCLDTDWQAIAQESRKNSVTQVTINNLAYVIYTSGSTGFPKGVQIPHAALSNFLQAMRQTPELTEQDTLLALTTYSFDIAGLELFLPITVGARLVIVSREVAWDGTRLLAKLTQSNATLMQATPATWQLLLGAGWQGNHQLKILCGGEALAGQLANQLLSRCNSLWNMYGPTETTIWSAACQVETASSVVPISHPIANTQFYILDQHGQLVPLGVPGELHIGGNGLARGYLNRPELTAEKFIPNPFSDKSASRLYKTGDLARYLPNGEIEYIGRIDHQVKLRGLRIELGEIEARLTQYPTVREAVVVVTENVPGDKRLVAYVVSEQELTSSLSELRSFLKEKLPEYMVPTAFVLLDALPLTPNGKVDRRLLPAPDISHKSLEVGFVPPCTPTEESLAAIWAEVLGLEQVGIHDNFFELGGHSLLAIQVMARSRSVFCIELPLRYLFENPTISELAEHIEVTRQANRPEDGKSVVPLPEIIPDPEQRYHPFPLTDIQQAYWVGRSQAFELGNVATHSYFEIESSDLNLERFNLVWQKLIERHDMLRAVVLPDGQQQILSQVPPYEIEILDLRGQDNEAVSAKLSSIRQQMSHQVLPTDKWPLFEIRATRKDEECLRLHLSFDALLADAWSMRCLAKEWAQLYQNLELSLPPLELSFRDYVLTEQRLQETELYQRSQDYWFSRLDTLPPAPELALAQNPGSLTQPRFQRHRGHLNRELWQQLQQRATQASVTPSGVLLAAFAEVLTVWSQSPRFSINLTLFNRLQLHPQANDIVGDFTSLTLLEVDNSAAETFATRVQRVQQQLWQDLDHRYVSGVRVLRELARRQGGTQRTAMPVVFTSTLGLNARNQYASKLNQLLEVVYSISQTSQVWLDHQVSEQEGELFFNWDAVEDLFPQGLLDDMFEAYCRFLMQLATSDLAWVETTRQLLPPVQLKQQTTVNATAAPTSGQLLHSLFTAQVEVRGHECAVVSPERHLTYLELYELANQVGHRLRQMGAEPNTLVAVAMEKGWEQVVAVLGVLMSGAAYLPIDPELPTERRRHLLETAQVQLVLTQPQLKENLEWPSNIQMLCLDNEELASVDKNPLIPVQTPEDLAYVIYTSGSTGLPKGVMIHHRGAVNTILDINRRFSVELQDRVLALSALSFDLSVYDIFGTLAAGATLIIPAGDLRAKDPAHWLELMAQHQVTLWNSVPAFMQMLVEYMAGQPEKVPTSLRLALLSGDWIPLSLPDQIKALWKDVQVVSLGGATEASIWSIFYPIKTVDLAWKSIPYGRPLTNQRFHVFNKLLEPCPVWVPGELYIGGVGLAKGYWQDQDKTRTSFLTHPRTGERLYRTGDLGRYLPDGNIEFLGREDFQVKLRGHRIELGEIEAVLAQHPAVRAAVVAAIGKSANSRRLVAYLVCDQESASSSIAAGDAPFQQLDGVLLDPVQRLEFKLKKPGLRADHNQLPFSQLVKPKLDQSLLETYFTRRRSHRRFLQESIAFEQFSQFLSCMIQLKVDGAVLPKSRYGSAGGLYPVQLYLYIKPERVEGLAGGTYYYHPQEHRLVLISAGAEVDRNAHGMTNRTTFDESAFSLFLIGQLNAISPMYGNKARDFCLIEAGLISQLLETSAPDYNLGLCQIGGFDFDQVRHLLALDAGHEYLYSLLGGRAEDAENGMLFENSSPVLSSKELQDRQSEAGGLSLRYASLHRTHVNGDFSAQIKIYLKEKLPEYMVPSAFVLLDALPLTPNGKVDRNALPEPDEVAVPSEVSHIAPHSEVEQTIAAIWKQVLQLDKVGVHDNFFDLGGNSVHIVRIHSKLQEVFHKKIAMVELFEYPTISSLATVLSGECR